MKSGILLLLVLASTQSLPQSQRYEDYFVHPYRREPQPLRPGLRIIGGQDAPPHVLPYQVGIYVYSASSTDFCGGSLISTNYVLTAAHCADQAMKMDLVFGAQNISDESEDTQIRISSTEFIVHEKWSRASLANDIALVKLSTPIKENDVIKIVPIAKGSNSYAGNSGIVSGWGKAQDDQTTVTEILKYLTSPILSNSQCSEASASYARIMNPTLLCLSGSGSVGTCGGDSGGPLVVKGVQVGLVSFGYKVCSAGLPSVFTRLSEYNSWIARNSDVNFI